jgi:translocation and assembly module TamB
MKAPRDSIRARASIAATILAVAVSIAAMDFVTPAAHAEPGDPCEIDLFRLLSFLPEGDHDRPPAVQWRGDRQPLRRSSPFADHRLWGRAAVDLQVDLRSAGRPSAPGVIGSARLVEGTYEHLLTGTLIENLKIDVVADGGNVIRLTFAGTDGVSGSVAGHGSLIVEAGGGIAIDGVANFTNFILSRRDDIAATATGSVAYLGTPCRGRIEGRLETNYVELRLAERLPPSVVDLEVDEIGAGGGAESGTDGMTAEGGWSGDLDLTIDMPGSVFVRGRGLASEWSGHLTVAGSWAKPELRGVLNLVRGEISFAGKVFAVREGVMVFERGGESFPLIDLAASHESEDLTAVMTVAGAASAPLVTLTSRPELPEGEILARVMFGKSVARLSPGQALRVAAALNAMSRGETMSEDGFGLARTLLGVDILDEERKRRSGGYRDWRLDTDRWADEQSEDGPTEIEIAPGVSVAAEQDEEEGAREGTFGVIWKWDY